MSVFYYTAQFTSGVMTLRNTYYDIYEVGSQGAMPPCQYTQVLVCHFCLPYRILKYQRNLLTT